MSGGEVELGGEAEGEGVGGGGDSLAGEDGAEFFEGAIDAFAGRFFGDAEGEAGVGKGFVFEVAKGNCSAIFLVEMGEGLVQYRGDFVGDGRLFGGDEARGHGGGLLFAATSAGFELDRVATGVTRGVYEPAGEGGGIANGPCASGENEEDGLRDVIGQMRVAHLPARGGVDEIQVTLDDRG